MCMISMPAIRMRALRKVLNPATYNNWRMRGVPTSEHKRVADLLGWSLDRLMSESDAHTKRREQLQDAVKKAALDLFAFTNSESFVLPMNADGTLAVAAGSPDGIVATLSAKMTPYTGHD